MCELEIHTFVFFLFIIIYYILRLVKLLRFNFKMLFKEAITLRILELCNKYNYTPNKLAELSAIAPSTLRALLANNVDNPSSTIIFKICKTLKIELKDFYDSPLFDLEKLEY